MTAFPLPPRPGHPGPDVFYMRGTRRRRGGPFGTFDVFAPGPLGRRRKAGRGDIRSAILALLAEQPMHGYQIIREIGERSEGAWMPSPGSVYPTLQQLTDEGLVSSSEADGKRVYELTADGRSQAEAREGPLPWDEAAEGADDDLVALHDLAFQVMAATRQVAHAGSKRQLAAAQEILRSTRKSLYQLLADDDAGEPDASGDQTPSA
jgi:DNA-binding PadR family transcriptional regulator